MYNSRLFPKEQYDIVDSPLNYQGNALLTISSSTLFTLRPLQAVAMQR